MLIEIADIEISAKCSRCNRAIDADFNQRTMTVEVEPCENCMDDEREAGRNEE